VRGNINGKARGFYGEGENIAGHLPLKGERDLNSFCNCGRRKRGNKIPTI